MKTTNVSRRKFLSLAGIAGASAAMAAMAGCSGSQESASSDAGDSTDAASETEAYTVQIPYYSSLCSAPFHIAIENGYFDDEGLTYNAFPEDNSDMDLVTSGKADVAYDLLPTIIQRIVNGLDIDVVMGAHVGCIKVVAKGDSGIETVEDLKGKTIGVPGSLGSDPAVMLQRVLTHYGIGVTPDNMEVDLEVYQATDLQNALDQDNVDAFVSWDPYASIVAKDMDGTIVWNQATDDYTKNEACCLVMLRPGFLEEHPDEALGFCNAIAKACDFIAENPEETAQIQIDNGYVANDDADLNAELLTSYNYKANVADAKESYVNCAEDLKTLGIIETDESGEDLADAAFAEVPGLDVE